MSPVSMENRQHIAEAGSSSKPRRQPGASVHQVKGYLRLCFETDSGANRTVLASCEQRTPLKVVRAFSLPDGGSLVHLHNLSGGVLGGDYLRTVVEVGHCASAQLTTTGATRLYQSRRESQPAVQTSAIKLCEGALLEYLPDPLIPFKGSRLLQETRIELAQGAGLFWWETIAPGREARDELFAYDSLQLRLDIEADGKPLAQERIKLEPARDRLSSLVRLGHYRYFSTFYICRVGLEASRWLALEKELTELARELSRDSELLWGVSTLPAHGLTVRALGVKGRAITSGLMAFWQAAKLHLYGRQAIPPRKVN